MDRISNFSSRIKEYREKHNMTLADIEKKTNVPAQTINRYELNQRSPKIDVAIDIADKLGVNALWLQGYDVPENAINMLATSETYTFKIEGEVAAGYGSYANDADTETIEIPIEWLHGLSPDNFFVLKVKGDSMSPDIEDGDLVLVHEENTVEPGTIAAVLYDSDFATLKKVNYNPKERWWMDLIPLNRNYEILHVVNEDLNRCKVLGPVWKLIRNFE